MRLRLIIFVSVVLLGCITPIPGRLTSFEESPIPTLFPTVADDLLSLSHLTGKIAFVSNQDGQYDIYTINADGSGLSRLTQSPSIKQYLFWSPDGKQIAFPITEELVVWKIMVMGLDGSIPKQLGESKGLPEIAWSPDGKKIAFSANRKDLFIVSADGSDVAALISDHSIVELCCPDWSPNGTKVAFAANQGDGLEIYVSDVGSETRTALTSMETYWNAYPHWSPDGKKILFTSKRTNANYDIYVMNADGTYQNNLTPNLAQNLAPSWSPDSSRIAFFSNRNGANKIYVMNADGQNQEPLTDGGLNSMAPAWSPDGTWIAFECSGGVCIVPAEGGSTIKLADTKQASPIPVWQPLEITLTPVPLFTAYP